MHLFGGRWIVYMTVFSTLPLSSHILSYRIERRAANRRTVASVCAHVCSACLGACCTRVIFFSRLLLRQHPGTSGQLVLICLSTWLLLPWADWALQSVPLSSRYFQQLHSSHQRIRVPDMHAWLLLPESGPCRARGPLLPWVGCEKRWKKWPEMGKVFWKKLK